MSIIPFILITLNLIFIYKGKRKAAIITFIITLIVSALIFKYHVTDAININL